MKISIENLGNLRHAEFKLKPLTVFIGDNCLGKTQAIVTATTMLSDYGLQKSISHLFKSSEYKQIPEIKKLCDDLITTSQAEINLVEFSKKYLPFCYANLGKLTPNCLSEILGYTVPVEKTAVTYTLSKMEIKKILSQINSSEIFTRSTVISKIIKERNSPILYLYTDANQKIPLPKPAIIHTLLELILGYIQSIIIPRLYHFPSERAGFSLLVTEIQKLDIQSPPLSDENRPKKLMPYAVGQYMRLIHRTLICGSRNERLNAVGKNPGIAKIEELSDLFTTITQDTISLSSPEPIFPRKVQIQAHNTVLDIQAASSGVKGLIGFSLYLHYHARPGDLIVIDEPEQNLHPKRQAAFVEFLTLLVNSGIQVAITTHSPHIIQHLQNLILAHDLKGKKEIIDSLYLKREDSFIDKKKVSVYLFQNNTAENILMKDGEINWQTFCDTANTIGNTTSLIYGKKHEEQECRMDTGEMSVAEDEPKYRE